MWSGVAGGWGVAGAEVCVWLLWRLEGGGVCVWHKWKKIFAAFGGEEEKFKPFSRVFSIKSAEKHEFWANFAQKSNFFLKIVSKRAIFNLSKIFRRLRRRKILSGGG